MLTINTNLSSSIAQTSLKSSTLLLNQAVERMTTGYKINHAKDNAANYSIATNMSTKLSAYDIAADNVAMGMDLVSTAEDIISNMQDKASRLHALCTQARNGTYGAQSLDAINSEAGAIISEIMRLYSTAEYNKTSLFNNIAYEIDSSLPKAGASGFIDETYVPIEPPAAKYNGFIEEIVEETPEIVVTDPSELADAIDNYEKIGIANGDVLAELAHLVTSYGYTYEDKTFVLTEDIDISHIANWSPIGNEIDWFAGNFNGNGHVIRGLNITSVHSYGDGLFGYITGTISNIGLENVNIDIKDDSSYTPPVGALAMLLYGGCIQNCYVKDGTVKAEGIDCVGGLVGDMTTGMIQACFTDVNVLGESRVGGLVGKGYDEISNSFALGDVVASGNYVGGLVGESDSPIYNCYAKGSISGSNYIGGLVGYSHDEVISSFATGNVDGNNCVGGLAGAVGFAITNSYATGNVSGSDYVGGLAGAADFAITNSYATGNVSGSDYVGGLVGKSTASITNCYATGNVTGTFLVGGLVGLSSSTSSSISNSYATGMVSGIDTSTTGSFIGSGTPTSITNCQAVAQNMDKIGSCTDTTLLAGITDVEIRNILTSLQVGINGDSSNQIKFDTNFNFDISAVAADISSDSALECINDLITLLSDKATTLGAVSNRLESALDSISVNIENLTSSRSTIRDADMAELSTTYVQQQILQQASATLLSTANQSPSIALQLI